MKGRCVKELWKFLLRILIGGAVLRWLCDILVVIVHKVVGLLDTSDGIRTEYGYCEKYIVD